MSQVQPFYEVAPLLALEWKQDAGATLDKFRQFILYHEFNQQKLSALLYRCAAVQLIYGYDIRCINGLGFDEERLKKEVGV